jgi:hypothetical protein
MKKIITLIVVITLSITTGYTQTYNWPCDPHNVQHNINGTFCENRIGDLGDRDHFHDGVDIHLPAGNPVYSVIDGTIDGVGLAEDWGINAYVRVGRYAYVHVDFNPALSIGDPVIAHETIIGTTNSWNHIHFKDGWPGNEINALRDGGGLTPFVDEFDPSIDYVNFYINGTTTEFQNNRVFERVEIVARARDKTDNGGSGDNNGIYSIGYQIYDASGTTPLTAPIENFVFDVIPPDDYYITNVYFPGSNQGTYIYSITNRITSDGYWDTNQLEPGTYKVKVFTEDTRSNIKEVWETVEVTFPDYDPPATPVLNFLTSNEANQWILRWFPNDSNDVAGYDLSFSLDGEAWAVQSSISNSITPADTEYVYTNFDNDMTIYFRLNAYDNAALKNYSDSSNAYGLRLSDSGTGILIVDGFDRTDGYWEKPSHTFVIRYGNIFSEFGLAFNTCSDDAIRRGEVVVDDYPIVVYLLGDESGSEKVLSEEEQTTLMQYLQNGGKLIISGSEIGSDLNLNGTVEDIQFYESYLKASFVTDSAGSLYLSGIGGTIFENYNAELNIPPNKIYKSDVIAPLGSQSILNFDDDNIAGIYFNGIFENGTSAGQLAYLTFPIELITDFNDRSRLIGSILGLFGAVSSIEDQNPTRILNTYSLYNNFPNPFNPSTQIRYQLAETSNVKLEIFSLNGQKVKILVDQEQPRGIYQVSWDGTDIIGRNVSSGVYIYRLIADDFESSQKMILLR